MKINAHQIKHFLRHFFTASRLGHGIHSPFAYKLCEEVFYAADSFYEFENLAEVREQLSNNKSQVNTENHGAGSKAFSSNERSIKQLVSSGISSRQQSELLFRLLNFLNCKTVVELGSSIGLNTLYLAKANSHNQVYSIEGSKQLAGFAGELAKQHQATNISIIHSTFEQALAPLLQNLKSLDFLYVDGNHSYEATMAYFELALHHKHNKTVFVFDDIYWSPGMTKAWNEIIKHPAVTLSIDGFSLGFVFFSPDIKEKVTLKMYL